jgi:apolipoprotein N-acyltransferase
VAFLRRFGPALVAVLGGAAWGLQFGAEGHLVAPWLAFAPLLWLLGSERPGRWAFLHGFTSWMVAIPWILPTMVNFGHLPGWLAGIALTLLAAYLGAYHWAFARLGAPLFAAGASGRPWIAFLGLPALWAALEGVRAWMLTGFPWNLAAYAWLEVPGALPLSAWIGAYGVSAVLVFANLGWALAARSRRSRLAAVGVLGPVLLLVVAGRFSQVEDPMPRLPVPVRIVQPNIANQVFYDPVQAQADYRRLLALSREACDREGALVIWPESAAWPQTYPDEPAFAADLQALVANGCPVLFNSAFRKGQDQWYNAAFLVNPGAEDVRYDKRHLVPFGEHVPLGRWLPFLSRIARSAGDFQAAEELVLLPWAGERLGPAICFEVVFPAEVAETTRAGASLLVTITNDAWYGDTAAPWQHLAAARFRAAENRRTLVRAAITGVSAVVDPYGRVEQQLGVGAEGIIRAAVIGRDEVTPYARRPWLVPLLTTVLAAGLWLWRWMERKRS